MMIGYYVRRRFLPCLATFTFLNATTADAQTVLHRDSTAVRVNNVSASVLTALMTWHLEGPTVRIGPASGGLEYEFHSANSSWLLKDGRIVVANDLVELRFFDVNGRYLTTVARRGRGPGEYEQLMRVIRISSDTLLAWDGRASRMDVRDGNGTLVRAFTIPRTGRFAGLGGRGAVFEEYSYPGHRKPGVAQDTAVLRQLREDGTPGRVVARLPGTWRQVLSNHSGVEWRGVLMSGEPMLSGNTKGVVYVQGDEFTVYWFGDSAQLAAITRVQIPRTRVTAADRLDDDRRRSDQLARNPRVRVETGQPTPLYANYLPQVSRVVVDSEGRAWVRRWTRYSSQTAEWIVLKKFGAPLARIMMPAALIPNDIGPDYVLGILYDGDGVQSIQKYRLIQSSARRD